MLGFNLIDLIPIKSLKIYMMLRNACLFPYMMKNHDMFMVWRDAMASKEMCHVREPLTFIQCGIQLNHIDDTNTDETIRTKLKPNTNYRTKWKSDQNTVMDV